MTLSRVLVALWLALSLALSLAVLMAGCAQGPDVPGARAAHEQPGTPVPTLGPDDGLPYAEAAEQVTRPNEMRSVTAPDEAASANSNPPAGR